VGLISVVSFSRSLVSTQRIQTMTKTAFDRQSKVSGQQSMPWQDCGLREQQLVRTQNNLIKTISPERLMQESQNHGDRKHEAIQSVKPKLLALIYRRNAFSRPASGMRKCLYPVSTLRPDTAMNPKKSPSLHDGIVLCICLDKSQLKNRSVDAASHLSPKQYAENGFSGEKYGQNLSVAYSFLRVGKIAADTRLQC